MTKKKSIKKPERFSRLNLFFLSASLFIILGIIPGAKTDAQANVRFDVVATSVNDLVTAKSSSPGTSFTSNGISGTTGRLITPNGSITISLTPEQALPNGWEWHLLWGDGGPILANSSTPLPANAATTPGWPGYPAYVDASTPGTPGSPGFSPQCSDNSDNDNNSLTDYPNDPGCLDPEDNDESGGAASFKWFKPKNVYAQTSQTFTFNISGLDTSRFYSFAVELCEPPGITTCGQIAWVRVGGLDLRGTLNQTDWQNFNFSNYSNGPISVSGDNLYLGSVWGSPDVSSCQLVSPYNTNWTVNSFGGPDLQRSLGLPYFPSTSGSTYTVICTFTDGDDVADSLTATDAATATINVNQLCTNAQPVSSGGSWTLNPSGQTGVTNAVVPGTYNLTVNTLPSNALSVSSVTSSDGGNSLNIISGQTKSFTINYICIPPSNNPPDAYAGPDKFITLPTSSSAPTGTSATDSDGTISSTVWTKISGPSATITNGNTLNPTFSNMSSVGTYVFQLTVTDNGSPALTDTDDMQVVVSAAPNIPPSVYAGTDKTITLPTTTSAPTSASATDSDGTIISQNWTKISGPSATITNGSTLNPTFSNMSSVGTYVFRLTATDDDGASASDDMQVTVNDVSPPPPPAGLTVTTSSTCGGYINVSWNSASGATGYKIYRDGSGSGIDVGNVLTYSDGPFALGSSHSYRVTAYNSGGESSQSGSQSGTASGTCNISPTANAGPDKPIQLPTTTSAPTGTSATDSDGTISSTVWSKDSGPSATITNGNTLNPTFSNMTTAGTYVFRLTVTDNQGSQGFDTMQVVVSPAGNISPTANAGPDKFITLPTSSSAPTGTSATDSDGTITSTVWSKISGPSATISNGSSLSPTFSNMNTVGTYVFRLTATDDDGASATNDMQVVVSAAANAPPSANAGPDKSIQLPTSTSAPTGTSATDSDSTISSTVWTKISGPSATITNGSTLNPTFSNMSSVGTYVFRLTVTDNGSPALTDTDDMQVVVTQSTITVTENGGAGGTWTINPGGYTGGNNTVTPAAAPGGTTYTLTVNSVPAGKTVSSITSTDGGNSLNLIPGQTKNFTINYGSNAAPTANAGPDKPITLPTTTSAPTGTSATDSDGTIASTIWSFQGGPGPTPTITNGSTLNPSFSGMTVAGTYTFRLTATDNLGATGSDNMNVVVSSPPFNYSLSNNGPITIVKGGSQGQVTITKTLSSGTGQNVTLTATGQPADVSVTYPNQDCAPTCSGFVTFQVPAGSSDSPGPYTITVTGQPLGKTTIFNLTINNPANVTISPCNSLGCPSGGGLIGDPNTFTANPVGCSSYTWSGTDLPTSPAPTGNPLSWTYQTTGLKTITVDTVCSGVPRQGQTTLQINVNPLFREF